MNTQHTPGDWFTSRHATPEHAPQFGVYADGQQNDLAIVMGENAEANAWLMANAPVLLAALYSIDANAAESVEWIRRVAREAIAEATKGTTAP